MADRDLQKAESRASVLDAARELFAERGYEATTTRAVAERAGVSNGAVFVHFPDKLALLEAALADEIDATLAAAWEDLPPVGMVDQLVHLATRLYAMYARHPALSKVLVQESLFVVPSADRPSRLAAQLGAFFARLAGLFDDARDRGEIPDDLPTPLAVHVFFALYFASLGGGLRGDLDAAAQRALLDLSLRRFLSGPGAGSGHKEIP